MNIKLLRTFNFRIKFKSIVHVYTFLYHFPEDMCQEIDKMNLSIFLSIFYVSLLTFNVIKYYTECGCFCICTQFLRCKNASNAYDIQEYI